MEAKESQDGQGTKLSPIKQKLQENLHLKRGSQGFEQPEKRTRIEALTMSPVSAGSLHVNTAPQSSDKFKVPSAKSAGTPRPSISLPTPNSQGFSPVLGIPTRAAFMEQMSAFYDQMEDTARMNAALREQIRKSTVLLQTLQGSGQMIEGLVRTQVQELVAQEKIDHLRRRVEELEARLNE